MMCDGKIESSILNGKNQSVILIEDRLPGGIKINEVGANTLLHRSLYLPLPLQTTA
jgi:hypothetical protein